MHLIFHLHTDWDLRIFQTTLINFEQIEKYRNLINVWFLINNPVVENFIAHFN